MKSCAEQLADKAAIDPTAQSAMTTIKPQQTIHKDCISRANKRCMNKTTEIFAKAKAIMRKIWATKVA